MTAPEKPQCHMLTAGNFPVPLPPKYVTGQLTLGGWSAGAYPLRDAYIIDLTGAMPREASPPVASEGAEDAFPRLYGRLHTPCTWLSATIRDFRTPEWASFPSDWRAIAMDVRHLLERGEYVQVCCSMGHGRTGMMASIILWHLWGADHFVTEDFDPIRWLRKHYCRHVVETDEQAKYVWEMCELDQFRQWEVPLKPKPKPATVAVVSPPTPKVHTTSPPQKSRLKTNFRNLLDKLRIK